MLILLQISQQISSLTINPSSINSTVIPITISEFVPDTTAIWVNAMWFTALILSLITASLGMLVKQWLRAYLASTFVAPKERCEVRWFRRTGLLHYRVPEIAAFLPLILQIALTLFFNGLILFIAPIHISIAVSLAVVESVWLLFLLVTTLIPVFSPACPYKAPCLEGPFRRFRKILETTFAKVRYTTVGVYFRWNLRGRLFTEATDVWRIPLHEDKVLFDAYETFKDSNVWEIVTRCIDLNNPFESIRKLSALFVSRRKEALLPWIFIGYDIEEADRRSLLKALVACFRKALSDVGNHSIFHHRHVDGLFILQEFGRSLTGSDESDYALSEIADHVLQEALSIPDAVDFVAGSIVMALPKSENLPQMSSDGGSYDSFMSYSDTDHTHQLCWLSSILRRTTYETIQVISRYITCWICVVLYSSVETECHRMATFSWRTNSVNSQTNLESRSNPFLPRIALATGINMVLSNATAS